MTKVEFMDLYKRDFSSLKGKLVGLVGELGTGKTYFVKNFLPQIDPIFTNQISSPTFNFCNIYHSEKLEVHHYDFYRLEEEEELFQIGIYESISLESVLTFIEWVDLFPNLEKRCDQVVNI